MIFYPNTKKTSMNFQETHPSEMKKTTLSNLSKNSNNTSLKGKPRVDNILFDIIKPVYHTKIVTVQKHDHIQHVNDISKPIITPLLPSSLLPAPIPMEIPFPASKTKTSEVKKDTNQPQVVYIPIEKMTPIIENIISTQGYVEKHVEEYFIANKISIDEINKQISKPMHDRIQKFLESLEMQNSLQKKNLQKFIETLVHEKLYNEKDHFLGREDIVKLVEDECKQRISKEYTSIHTEVNELKKKQYVTKKEVVELFDEINVTRKKYEAIYSDLSELKKKAYVTKKEVVELFDESRLNCAAIIAEVLELKTKNFVTKTEVEKLMDERKDAYATKAEILDVVDGKMYALNMEFLVQNYVIKMIEHGENDEKNTDEDDEPKTRFEEIIQPSIARIIHRVLKYDQAHTDQNQNSVSLHFEVDDVYDMERQEKDHFTDIDAKGSIYNPMYSNEPNVYNVKDDTIVEMGSVYKGEESGSFLYENELRKTGDRRWNRFGNGIDTAGSVIDLFLDKVNRKIYIVGNFKSVNRVPLENIAVFDLNEKKWKHVGEGIPQVATAIAVDEENEIVYVGGVFSKVGKGEYEVPANNVAAYNVKEKKWYALGEGLNRDCSTIIFDSTNKRLYAGGSFTQSGEKGIKYVAMYDIESKNWQSLKGGSVNGPCRIVLKTQGDDLYLGGLFTHAGNDDIHVSYVARYNLKDDTWYSLGGGLQGYCNAITYDVKKNKLYVGGTFTSVGSISNSINANHIAEYDIENNSWNDMDGGLNNIVQSIFYDASNECVYVGGTFTHSFENNIQLNHIARYDLKESKWYCLENHFPNTKPPKEEDENDNVGLNGNCKVMSVDNKSLFIAGSFQIAGNITANSIVRYSLMNSNL